MTRYQITPPAGTDRFDKSAAADDRDVVTFFIVEVSEIDSKFDAGKKEKQVCAHVVNHTKQEVYRDALVWGALARQLDVDAGAMVAGRMKKGAARAGMSSPVVLDEGGVRDCGAALEAWYELNVEITDDGYRLRDDPTFDASTGVSDEPF